MEDKTTRREFLKQAALTGAAITGMPAVAGAAQSVLADSGGKSRVVIATNTAVLKGDNQIARNVLQKMLDRGVAKLTQTSTGADGWEKLFSPDDVVGIKINCLFTKGASTRPEVVDTVVQGLKTAGVKEDNIIIWDRSTSDMIKSGFTPNKDGPGVKCYGDDGDWGETLERGAFKGRITKVISQKVTALVNAPILKTHGLTGISCCLKNHYGSFDNPGSHHRNHGNPAMADFSSIPMVKSKTRLVVVDALRAQYDGGPGLQPDAQFNYHSLMVSTDPVAADSEGLRIIEQKRKDVGLKPFANEVTAWLQSAQDRSVGVCDSDNIEVFRV